MPDKMVSPSVGAPEEGGGKPAASKPAGAVPEAAPGDAIMAARKRSTSLVSTVGASEDVDAAVRVVHPVDRDLVNPHARSLGLIDMRSIAPTLARVLNVTLEGAELPPLDLTGANKGGKR